MRTLACIKKNISGLELDISKIIRDMKILQSYLVKKHFRGIMAETIKTYEYYITAKIRLKDIIYIDNTQIY